METGSLQPTVVLYGDDTNNQFIRVYKPPIIDQLIVIIHGGFWKAKFSVDNSLIENLVPYFTAKKYGVCTLEYRRREHDGGGWPGTNQDIVSGLKKLHENFHDEINFSRVVLLGHSAGGTLALWTCCKLLDRGLPFTPLLCIAIAPVGDLRAGYERRLGDEGDVVAQYMHCEPLESHSSYSEASPIELLPLEVETLLVVGSEDDCVPADLVQSFFVAAMTAHVEISLPRLQHESESSQTVFLPMSAAAGSTSLETSEGQSSSGPSSGLPSKDFEYGRPGPTVPIGPTAPTCPTGPPQLLLIPGANHFEVVSGEGDVWAQVFDKIDGIVSRATAAEKKGAVSST